MGRYAVVKDGVVTNVIVHSPDTGYAPEEGELVELNDDDHGHVEPGLEYDGHVFHPRKARELSDDEMVDTVHRAFQQAQSSMYVDLAQREELRRTALRRALEIRTATSYAQKRSIMEAGLQELSQMAVGKTGG